MQLYFSNVVHEKSGFRVLGVDYFLSVLENSYFLKE